MRGVTFYKKEAGDTTYRLQINQKRPTCNVCDNTFIMLASYVHPFMFTRVASANNVTTFTIKNASDSVVATLSNDLVKIINAGDIDYIYANFAPSDLAEPLDCGYYYYELTIGSEVYYSEFMNNLNLDIEISSNDIAVNGQFTTDLTGWTTSGTVTQITTGGSGAAQIAPNGSISQDTAGYGIVKVVITTSNTYTQGMYVSYGQYEFPLVVGVNTFYFPSHHNYTISNQDTIDANDLIVLSVEIFQIEQVPCYNLVMGRSSCNRSEVPYTPTGYTDVFVLDGELSEPTYPREDEAVNNYQNTPKLTAIKITKRHELSLSNNVFEPLLDELQKLPVNEIIYIYNAIWNQAFYSDDSTVDITIESEYPFDNKCDAEVRLIISTVLASANSCCEVIEDMSECCESFEYDLSPLVDDVFTLTITTPCEQAGVYYYIDRYDTDEELVSSTLFETEIEYDTSIAADQTYKVRASKFGCDDIVYDLLVS